MPIRVTIELIPNGDESRKSTMATMDIENIRMYPDDDTADYSYDAQVDGKHYVGDLCQFYRPNGFLGLVSNVAEIVCIRMRQPAPPAPEVK